MPIYPYRCAACGFATEVMRKISEPLLTTCPKCQSEQFSKQLTAPGFQLKGTGWYATDFKNSGAKPVADKAGKDAGKEAGTATDGAPDTAAPAAATTEAPTAAPTETPAAPPAKPATGIGAAP